MPLAAAERRVKGLPVLFPDSDAYTAVNNRLETIAAYYAPAWQNDRLRNLYLDVSGTAGLWGPAFDCASRVMGEILENTGITPAGAAAEIVYTRADAWEPLHPRLVYILNEADADILRKVITKKAEGSKLASYEKRFFEGCIKNGIDIETIKQIWERMLSFDGYSFCKPHSASYAIVSFQSAWLWLRVYYRVRLSCDDIIALVPSGVFDSISGGKTRALQARTLSRLCANSGHTRYSEGSLDEGRP